MAERTRNPGKQGKIKQTKSGRDTWRYGADGWIIPQNTGQEEKLYPSAKTPTSKGRKRK